MTDDRIRFRCASCGRAVVAPVSRAGRRGRCPDCGATLTVPVPEGRSLDRTAAEPSAGTEEGSAVRASFVGRDAEQQEDFRYEAFISYRHVEPDRRWARWLHGALEAYRVPRRLVRERKLPRRLRRVFRDEEELPASADLSREIESALRRSRFLIVVCTRSTPESEWVNKEIVRFREMGRDDQILALLIDGEPGEAFPRALREIRRTVTDRRGMTRQQVEQTEPLAADVRPERTESRRYLKRMAKLRILACITGVPFDDLRQRERERRTRRMALAGLLALCVAVTVCGLLWGLLSQRDLVRTSVSRAQESRQVADLERARASAEQDRAEVERYANKLLAAQRAIDAGDQGTAGSLLEECDPEHRGWEWGWLRSMAAYRLADMDRCFPLGQGGFSPDGRRIVLVSYDGLGCIHDAATGAVLKTLGDIGGARIEAFNPAREQVAIGHGDGRLMLWDSQQAELLFEMQAHARGIRAVAFSGDGRLLATASIRVGGEKDEPVKVWDAATGEFVSAIQPEPWIQGISFGGGARLMTWLLKSIDVWDATSGRPIASVQMPESAADHAVLSTDGTRIAVTESYPNRVSFWSAESGARVLRPITPSSRLFSIAFSPDGEHLAGGSDGGRVFVWSTATGQLRHTLTWDRPDGHLDQVQFVTFSGDGSRLLARSGWSVVVWEFGDGPTITAVESPTGRDDAGGMSSIAFTPDGRRLLGSAAGFTYLWSTGGKYVDRMSVWAQPISFGPEGKLLVSRPPQVPGPVPTYVYPDLDTGRTSIYPVALSHDGTKFLTFSDKDHIFRLYDARNGARLALLESHGTTGAAAFSLDDKRLATCGADGTVRIWDLDGREVTRLAGARRPSVAFARADRYIVGVGSDSAGATATVWEIKTRLEVGSFTSQAGSPGSPFIRLNPAGSRAVTRGGNHTLDLWHIPTGVRLLTLHDHSSDVLDAAFSPDGLMLATCSQDGLLIRTVPKAAAPAKYDEVEMMTPEQFRRVSERVMRNMLEPQARDSGAAAPPEGAKILTMTREQSRQLSEQYRLAQDARVQKQFGITVTELTDDLRTEHELWRQGALRVETVAGDSPVAELIKSGDIILGFSSPRQFYFTLRYSLSGRETLPLLLFDPVTGERRTVDFPRIPDNR